MTRRLLAAVAAVALLVAGCTSSTSGKGTTSSSNPPATTASATGSPIPAPSTPPNTSAPATTVAPVPRSGPLNGFLVADVTFVGTLGWALGTVGCTQKSGRCPAIAHSTDNGRSWYSIKVPNLDGINVAIPGLDTGGCTVPCESHIRFATPAIGYLFGGSDGPMFVTTDGGRSWRNAVFPRANQLETLDGNVIAVYDHGGCPPGCAIDVVTGRLGYLPNPGDWRGATLPGKKPVDGIILARTGSHAYLLGLGHPAGGAQDARSTLWTSADDGRHWSNRGEPCPQGSREVDSVLLTPAPDGSVTVLCRNRVSGRQFVATSTDGGAHFRAGSRTALGGADVSAIGAASASTILVSSDDTYRSTDGGRRFARLSANSGSSPGALGWLGFASPTVAHAISIDRRTLWTSTDAGRSWRAGRLR